MTVLHRTRNDFDPHSVELTANIGRTPLIKLTSVTRGLSSQIEVYAKAEHLNPGGSVKDRAARAIILDAERDGRLIKGKIILDATSGNTGIAYAMIGAAIGYRVAVCLPQNASTERKRIWRAYGAEIIETDPLLGTDGAQIQARSLAAEMPERYFYADQYNNNSNWKAHYHTTALEIWEQTNKRITHFVAGLGTSGTFVGTTRRLKELNPGLRSISMQPDTPLHGLEGMKHMATAIVPGIYDASLADEEIQVSSESAQEMSRRLASAEGLFVGVSSGGNVLAAIEVAKTLSEPAIIVTILCDGGSRYLGDSFWDEGSRAHL